MLFYLAQYQIISQISYTNDNIDITQKLLLDYQY